MDAETKNKSESFVMRRSALSALSITASGIVDLSDAELTALGFLGESKLRASWTVHLQPHLCPSL